MPRSAIVVPLVMSETWTPIIRPSVNSEFISGRPQSFFGLAEMLVDVQRLRVECHVGEQHIVHLRDGPVVAVLVSEPTSKPSKKSPPRLRRFAVMASLSAI